MDLDTITSSNFRALMRWLAAGVAIVTSTDGDGAPCGLTATSVCLVSWQPPLLLACVAAEADCSVSMCGASAFAIHLLREDQEDVSRRFAATHAQKFTGLAWHAGRLGAPVLDDCLAHVECRTSARYAAGDHTILVGEAAALGHPAASGTAHPLLYFRGRYARLRADEA